MSSSTKLQQAVRGALGLSVGTLALGVSPGALAQDGVDDLEEIVVTGSRIKRADLGSASPITVLDRQYLLGVGLTDVGNLLQRMPSMSGSPIGTTTNNGNTAEGVVEIDLRGMGADRTVTLINGRRVVDGGDYQTIPATMIDRVEILKDGASAAYGADAVAGVVNIITRRDFEGIEVSLQTADFFDMDSGVQNTIGIIAGTQFAGGNVVFGAEYVDQEEAFQRDAPWEYFQHSYYIYPEGCENFFGNPYDGSATSGCFDIGSSRIPETRIGFIGGATGQGTFLIDGADAAATPYEVGLMTAHDGRTYNYAPVNYIQTPYTRANLFVEANFEVAETVEFNSTIRANFRDSSQELAPLPYNSPTDPGFAGVFMGVPYNGISEDNYYLRRAVDVYNAANPLATQLTYQPLSDVRRRMVETNRRFEQEVTQFQAAAGLTGTFNEVDWDLYYNKGYRSLTALNKGQFSGAQLGAAMGPSMDLDGDGQPECYQDIADPSSVIAGCVPFNFFGGAFTVTPDMIAGVSANISEHRQWEMDEISFSITGSGFELPGGQLGWATGYQYFGQRFTYDPDSQIALATATGNTGGPTRGTLNVNAVFGELFIPVFDNGAQSIDIKAGARYDNYNRFSEEVTWQLGVELQAVESLKLRSTYGTVFRTPTIEDLFEGQADDFPTYSDPCIPAAGDPLLPGCAQVGIQLDTQVLARVGGNPNLIPETGDTFTAGFVWTPEFGDTDLSVTVDYWQIDLEDGISSLGVQFILDDCYERQAAASCAFITRRPDYSIAQIIDGSLNVAEQGAQGVDIEIRFSFDTEIGQFETALLWSNLIERTKKPSIIDATFDLSGRYTDTTAEDGGGYPENKVNFSVQWFRNDLSIGYLGEFISGLDADTFCNCGAGNRPDGSYVQDVDSVMYHDLIANYHFANAGTTIAVGVTNLTDEEPPYIEVGFNATTDVAIYRLFGRGYYVRLTQAFQ